MNVFLDSAFVIDHLNGQPVAVALLRRIFDRGDQPLVNEIVVCEVRAGLREEDADILSLMLEPFEFVQPGPETAILAGSWRAEAHRRGRALSLADGLIAAAAYSNHAKLLTRNVRDFALTPVAVETY
jgi:predicted nucleic acid-binding protein